MAKRDKLSYGFHSVKAILSSDHEIKKVWLDTESSNERQLEIASLCGSRGISVLNKSSRFLDKICESSKHQGVVVQFIPKELQLVFESNKNPRRQNYLCLYLDQIQDPHNFGAIVRSAEYYGVDQIFYPAYKQSPFNATALKAAAGAASYNPPYKVSSISSFFEKCLSVGFQIAGTFVDGENKFSDILLDKPLLLVVGNEGEGISSKVEKYCQYKVGLSKFGQVDSLNVSVATGVCLDRLSQILSSPLSR